MHVKKSTFKRKVPLIRVAFRILKCSLFVMLNCGVFSNML